VHDYTTSLETDVTIMTQNGCQKVTWGQPDTIAGA
jgi:hypothetical protein